MGYAAFTPTLVYGVKEQKDGSCIDVEDLEMFGVEGFATEVNKCFAMDIVYGCNVELDEYKSGSIFKGKEEVDSFAEKFADLFKSQKPEFCLCLRGDFEVRDYYNLDKVAVKEQEALLEKKEKAEEEKEEALVKATQGEAKRSKVSD